MTALRELSSPPGTAGLYARAALPLLPGASALPFVAGGHREIPEIELGLDGVRIDLDHLADYVRVCGLRLRNELPATYPHILAFPLHMALMTDGRFPFPAIGLVHIANRIRVHRPLLAGETLDLRVRATPIEPHPRGRSFSIVSEAWTGGELVWEDVSTMLRRGGGSDGAPATSRDAATTSSSGSDGAKDAAAASTNGDGGGADANGAATPADVDPAALPSVAEWRLGEDLGRRYGAASGDRNPIHIHALTARLLGFPRAIAHGMWTKARCIAALEAQLPDAYTVDVQFRKPILLPGRVTFAADESAGAIRFAVRGRGETTHLKGTVTS